MSDMIQIFERLTAKQHQTLQMIAEGRTHKEIAFTLGISISAATQRVENLRRKFGGVSKQELGRISRTMIDEAACKNLTGKINHLPPDPLIWSSNSWHETQPTLPLADYAPFESEGGPWAEDVDVRIVPEVLDGKNASVMRWVAMIAIAIGLVALVILLLAASQAIASLS